MRVGPARTDHSAEALQWRLDRVNDALRSAGIEHPLGPAGVTDLAAMASGRLEDLQTAEAEVKDLTRRLNASKFVCGERERELLELKGPCSSGACRLHYAHSGPCDRR